MLIKRALDIIGFEITSQQLYLDRHQFISSGAIALTGLMAPSLMYAASDSVGDRSEEKRKTSSSESSGFSTREKFTDNRSVTNYVNFYEFSTDKEAVADLARDFKVRPWTVSVEGHIKKPKVYDVDELIKLSPIQERIYRMRCVEGWSMVIPWEGFPLGDLIKRLEPTGDARFVEFTTLMDPQQMPGQRRQVLDWPYVEGLRLDEALHPLTLLATGMYGKTLPNQNGAPLRLVVPWKYGFKSIKSIIRIRFTKEMPISSWMNAGPREYGFYANVNPNVDHPRWSQARERRIGEFRKRKTLMFNGYADQVGQLYADMDLRKFF